MTKRKTAYRVPEVKRSKTGNNPCQCLVRKDDDWIDPEMQEMGYSPDTHRFFDLGCGAFCSNRFAQGHDAKLKSELIKAFRDNVEIGIYDGSMLVSTDPMNMAQQLGWGHFMTAAKAKAPRKAKAKEQGDEILPMVRDEIGQAFGVGDTVEFNYRQKRTTAMVVAIDGEEVVLTWGNAKGTPRQHQVDANRCTVIA